MFRDIEMPLTEVLAGMEYYGFRVDTDGIRAFGSMLEEQIEKLRSEMFEIAGYEFNPNSTNDLSGVLFTKLGLPARKKTKTDILQTQRCWRVCAAIIPLWSCCWNTASCPS